MKTTTSLKKCPCGNDASYEECCKLAHDNPSFIETAEALMRSRYVAFTLADVDYLVATHHSDSREKIDQKNLGLWAKSVRWIRLEVLKVENGTAEDEEGIVEFRASYQEGKRFRSIHEKSLFKREFGTWVYFGKL